MSDFHEAVTRTLAEHRFVINYGNSKCACGLDVTTDEELRLLPDVAAIRARHDAHLADVLAALHDDRLAEPSAPRAVRVAGRDHP